MTDYPKALAAARGIVAPNDDDARIAALVAERSAAKKACDFARADAIRDELAAAGIVLKDTPQGVRWSMVRAAAAVPESGELLILVATGCEPCPEVVVCRSEREFRAAVLNSMFSTGSGADEHERAEANEVADVLFESGWIDLEDSSLCLHRATTTHPAGLAAVPEVDWRALYRFQKAMRYMDADAKLTRGKAYAMADQDVDDLLAAALAERKGE